PALAGADDVPGHLLLALDHLVDLLFQCTHAEELVHQYVARLADAEGAVGRLVLDRRVPPAVEVKDVPRRRQVETRAARLEREHEDARASRIVLEALHQPVALL